MAENTITILTLTCNNLGISWGPAINFLELWNGVSKNKSISVTGLYPSWTEQDPILNPEFELVKLKGPNIRFFRQIVFDFCSALYILKNKKTFNAIYVRLSHWHIFTILVLMICKLKYFVEVNGLAKEDSVSAKKNAVQKHLYVWQEQILLKKSKAIVAVSEGIKKTIELRYQCGFKTKVIKNGVAEKLFSLPIYPTVAPDQKIRVIYVGTFTPWDGSDLLPDLAKNFPDCEFIMIGDGGRKEEVRSKSPKNMIFKGRVHYRDLNLLYSDADCAVVLYEFERHKNVELSSLKTLEYVAAGLPVFSTNVNGQDFIVKMGFGMLINSNDDLNLCFKQFIKRIKEYKNNYVQSRNKMKTELSWSRVASETTELVISDIVPSNKPSAQVNVPQ